MGQVTNKKIGVLMGGLSSEREVSLATGDAILKALQEKGYNAIAIDVGRDVAEVIRESGIEIAFNGLHGKYGEDGAIQGLLEVSGIPVHGLGHSRKRHGHEQDPVQAGLQCPAGCWSARTWSLRAEKREQLSEDALVRIGFRWWSSRVLGRVQRRREPGVQRADELAPAAEPGVPI